MEFLSTRDNGEIKTVHSSKDQRIVGLSLAVAEVHFHSHLLSLGFLSCELFKEAKAAHQYTDTTGFTLKCLVCGVKMKGEAEAQQHAMSTKHTNFSEV